MLQLARDSVTSPLVGGAIAVVFLHHKITY